MTKQYRLKITWSNGDSEYAGKPAAAKAARLEELMNEYMSSETFVSFDNKSYSVKHIRKIEFEEYIPDKEMRF